MTSKKACGILLSFARAEKQLEILRQTLCELENFEPYAVFRRLDYQRKNYLQVDDFLNYFSSNRQNFDEQLVHNTLIKHYDYDRDGKLCYAEFLRILLPNDEPGLRTLVTQRPTYSGELSEEIESALLKLLQSEVTSVLELEDSKKELLDNGLTTVSQIFNEIDKDSSGYINFQNLFDFFKKNGIYPYEEELIAIIRKLDKDDDGRLVLAELEEGLSPVASTSSYGYNNFKKESYSPYYDRTGKFDKEESDKKARGSKDYPWRNSQNKDSQSQYVYKNDTFNPSSNSNNPIDDKNTSLKKSYNYEKKYQGPTRPSFDEALTEKQLSKSYVSKLNDDKEDAKPIRNYNYSYTQKTSSYEKKRPSMNQQDPSQQEKPEETKDYLNKYLQKDYKNPTPTKSNSNNKYDYSNENITKSPPRTFYYPHEPIRKIFSPMKDKILKSSRFDQPAAENNNPKPRGYQINSNPQRTRTPINRPEAWRIEEKLKRIDDNYAKNSRYNYGAPRESKQNEDLTKSAPKEFLYRDYTPDPASKKRLYQTMNLTPDKLFETSYLQSSQYRKDREIVDKIMGPSEQSSSQRPNFQESNKQQVYSSQYSMKNNKTSTPLRSQYQANNYNNSNNNNSEIKDLLGYFSSLLNYEGELERMKQDLALRPDFNIVDLFVFFDGERKGNCSIEEFIETLQEKIELFVQEKEALLFMKRFDRTMSGVLKFADFSSAFTPLLSEYKELLNQRKPINTDLEFSIKELFSQETIRLITNIFRAHFTNEIAIEGLRKALNRKGELNLKRLFENVDRDQDGFLNEYEIEMLMSSQGGNYNKNDFRLIMERIDNDKDGKISFDEFCFELNSKLEELE